MVSRELAKEIYEHLLRLDTTGIKSITLQRLVWRFEDRWRMEHIVPAVRFLADRDIIWEEDRDGPHKLGLKG